VKKKVKKQSKPESPKPKPIDDLKEKENQFDFGGLPKRDLKKNLGC
jgi:hypothetical protein